MKKTLLTILFLLLIQINIIPKNQGGCLEMDVILIADMSTTTMGYEIFIANAFDTFMDRFELSDTGIRIGVVLFNDNAYMFDNFISDKKELKATTRLIKQSTADGNTNMVGVFNVADYMFTNGGRPNVKKVMIVISDGDMNVMEDNYSAFNRFITIHPDVYICGVLVNNQYAQPEYMQNISNEFCYFVSEYRILPEIFKTLDICM